jgi:urease accessory protein UreH
MNLAIDSRSPAAIGRQARLELVFERRRGRTVLAHSYAEPPFRIGRVFELDDAAYLIIVCTGAGIFGGDTLHQSVDVGPGARVVLTSQSALQVHPPAPSILPAFLPSCRPALLDHEYVVAPESELHCHWDPVIPFAGARLIQRFNVNIAESSRLYWGDAVMAGRISRGETWQFASLTHELSLRVGRSLAYLERYTLTPQDRAVTQPWVAGDATYFATAIAHHPRAARANGGRSGPPAYDCRPHSRRRRGAVCRRPGSLSRSVARHNLSHAGTRRTQVK